MRIQEGIDQDLQLLLLFAFTRKQLNGWYIIQNSLVYKFLSLAGSSAGDVLVFGLRLWYEKMEKGGVWEFWKFYIFFWSISWPPSRALYQANDEATLGCWRYNIVLGWISSPHFCPRLVGYRIQRTTTIQIREVRFKRNRVNKWDWISWKYNTWTVIKISLIGQGSAILVAEFVFCGSKESLFDEYW